MQDYNDFEATVKKLPLYQEKWVHILPEIQPSHRQRFIDVMNRGVDMPNAFDLILITKDMSDELFDIKLRQTLNKV